MRFCNITLRSNINTLRPVHVRTLRLSHTKDDVAAVEVFFNDFFKTTKKTLFNANSCNCNRQIVAALLNRKFPVSSSTSTRSYEPFALVSLYGGPPFVTETCACSLCVNVGMYCSASLPLGCTAAPWPRRVYLIRRVLITRRRSCRIIRSCNSSVPLLPRDGQLAQLAQLSARSSLQSQAANPQPISR